MTHFLAIVCILFMLASLVLLFLGLPGTWVILGLTGLWAYSTESPLLTTHFFVLWGSLCLLGEIAEFAASYYGAKQYGSSNKGSIGGLIGALIGGILCAPLFFGFGALLGILAGGFTGCLVVELLQKKPISAAAKAAFGVTIGRFGGFLFKLGVAVALLWSAIPAIWSGI